MGFRIGVTGAPVFWREGHVPEDRIGQHELHSHMGKISWMPVNVNDNTFQRRFCLDVQQSEALSSVHLRRRENQRTVSTDGPRVSVFFKGQSSAELPGDSDWDGHQHSLTPSAVRREPGGFAGFGKPRFKSSKVLWLNGSKNQPHARGSSGVDDSCPGFKQLRTLFDAYVRDCPQGEGVAGVHVTALLTQVTDARGYPRAGFGRYDFSSGSELVARMNAAVGLGKRDGRNSRIFRSPGDAGRTRKIFRIIRTTRRARKLFHLTGEVERTRKIFYINGNVERAPKVFCITGNPGRAHGLFQIDGSLGKSRSFRASLALAIAALHNHTILTQKEQRGVNTAPDNARTGKENRKETRLQARALSIISSQMPLDLRMISTSSRAAPLPPSALVV